MKRQLELTVVPVVAELAICKQFSGPHEITKLVHGRLGIITAATVQVSVKDASVQVDDKKKGVHSLAGCVDHLDGGSGRGLTGNHQCAEESWHRREV